MAIIKYYCKWQGCREQLAKPGYCDKHKPLVELREIRHREKRKEFFKKAQRANEAFYKTKDWRELRAKVLRLNPFCALCGDNEKLHVDHIEPPRGSKDLFFTFNNLQVLCDKCHRLKTACEINSRKARSKNINEVRNWLKNYVESQNCL